MLKRDQICSFYFIWRIYNKTKKMIQ